MTPQGFPYEGLEADNSKAYWAGEVVAALIAVRLGDRECQGRLMLDFAGCIGVGGGCEGTKEYVTYLTYVNLSDSMGVHVGMGRR